MAFTNQVQHGLTGFEKHFNLPAFAIDADNLFLTKRGICAYESKPRLTDSVYHYDSKDKIFELGEKFVNRMLNRDSKENSIDETKEKESVVGSIGAKKEEIAAKPPKEVSEKAAKSKGGEAI